MNTVIHPALAAHISRYINRRSIAANMIDAVLKAAPFVRDDFLYWVEEHRLASGELLALGIEVVTYEEEHPQL